MKKGSYCAPVNPFSLLAADVATNLIGVRRCSTSDLLLRPLSL